MIKPFCFSTNAWCGGHILIMVQFKSFVCEGRGGIFIFNLHLYICCISILIQSTLCVLRKIKRINSLTHLHFAQPRVPSFFVVFITSIKNVTIFFSLPNSAFQLNVISVSWWIEYVLLLSIYLSSLPCKMNQISSVWVHFPKWNDAILTCYYPPEMRHRTD